MSELLKLEIEAICIVHIISIVLALVFLMMFYVKTNKDYATKAFLVLQISIIGWLVFKIFKTVSTTEISRWWFIVGYYFCACVFEVAYLEFTYAYYKGRPLKNVIRKIIYAISLLQFSMILTNPMHHLFYAQYDFWGDSFGILFYFHMIIVYGFIFVGFIYGYLTFQRRFKGERLWYKSLIASAILFPLLINVLFITKILHRFIHSIGIPVMFDITPIAFVFSILIFVYATFNHEFINRSPMMRHEIVHRLDTPICVLDSSYTVIYINEKLKETLGKLALEKMDESIQKMDVNRIKNKKVEMCIDHQLFTVLIRPVHTFQETQYITTLHNITGYKEVEEKIREEQEALIQANSELETTIHKLKRISKIGARNYVARELHDILGHSLVVTIKLLEVAKLYVEKDRKLSLIALNDSVLSLDSGLESLHSMATKSDTYSGKDLKKEIENMLQRIKTTGIKTRFSFKGLHYNLDEKTYDIICRICQELITNALKHASAKEIFISISIDHEKISILVMDNGKGADEFVWGNGLIGIQERLHLINGTVSFITSAGEGFLSKITIKK